MGSRKNELIMSGAVIVSKDGNVLKTKINNYKTPIKVSPKIPTPNVIANSGLKNMSLIFSNKTQGYHMAFREMNYDITEKQVVQSGKAYSLYFEITDDEDTTYLEGNIIPLESNKGVLFLSVNVSPKNPENVDLFSLPIVIRYKGSFLSIIKDLSSIISNLKKDASTKRNRIYGKMVSLLEAFPDIYANNRNRLDIINNLELSFKVTLMDFNFTCCLENALSLTDCVLSVPDIEEICAECLVLPDCLAACFDFLTLPACLVCFSLDVLACAYCVYKAGECTEDAIKVIDCCK